jgi:hypothetical protein
LCLLDRETAVFKCKAAQIVELISDVSMYPIWDTHLKQVQILERLSPNFYVMHVKYRALVTYNNFPLKRSYHFKKRGTLWSLFAKESLKEVPRSS